MAQNWLLIFNFFSLNWSIENTCIVWSFKNNISVEFCQNSNKLILAIFTSINHNRLWFWCCPSNLTTVRRSHFLYINKAQLTPTAISITDLGWTMRKGDIPYPRNRVTYKVSHKTGNILYCIISSHPRHQPLYVRSFLESPVRWLLKIV